MAFRVKIVVAYLGAPFHGWQRQSGQRTVQGELERALSKCVGGTKITVMGAGRTDAGVHAAGQTAHCDLPGRIPPEKLVSSLNAILPPEIRVRSARPVGTDFHAQKSALGKVYTYRIRWRERSAPVARSSIRHDQTGGRHGGLDERRSPCSPDAATGLRSLSVGQTGSRDRPFARCTRRA